MGKKRFWTYRVEVWCGSTFFTPDEWRVRRRGDTLGNGRPTVRNLARYVEGVDEMLKNEPYARFKFGPVTRARIVHQETDTVVAEWTWAAPGSSG